MMQQILVIDDQPEILEIIEMIISNYFDCRIETASNVTDAMELCENSKFNVICTDYVMPDQSGADFIKMLRNGSSINKDTDVLIITGNEDLVDKSIESFGKVKVANKLDEVQKLVTIFENYLKS